MDSRQGIGQASSGAWRLDVEVSTIPLGVSPESISFRDCVPRKARLPALFVRESADQPNRVAIKWKMRLRHDCWKISNRVAR
jgi:hypothetical protein